MMREFTLVVAVLPLLFACSEEEEDDKSSNEANNSSSGGSMGAGGSVGAGGTVSTSDGDTTGGGSGGSATSGGGDSVCERGCVLTIEADCENGPSDMEQCVDDCERLTTGECSEEYGAFQECAEGEPVTCQSGIPAVAACSSEQSSFIACINR